MLPLMTFAVLCTLQSTQTTLPTGTAVVNETDLVVRTTKSVDLPKRRTAKSVEPKDDDVPFTVDYIENGHVHLDLTKMGLTRKVYTKHVHKPVTNPRFKDRHEPKDDCVPFTVELVNATTKPNKNGRVGTATRKSSAEEHAKIPFLLLTVCVYFVTNKTLPTEMYL